MAVALTPGARLGPYEILELLGSGGMGEVYRARDPRLGRDVALKVVLGAGEPDSARLRRFEAEAHAVAALSHPNVLTVHDVGSHEGRPFLVLELLEGESLRERLERGPLPPRRAVEVAVEVCRGLDAAHSHGLVHRDLKPENIFLTSDGRVKILDFGLAKATRGDVESGLAGSAPPGEKDTLTEPGIIVGTLGYLSPEQARGLGADARSDLFALGAVLYEMVTGRRAFSGQTPADTLSAILNRDPPAMTSASGPIAPALDRVVRECLAKDPEERFHSAHDLALALEAVRDRPLSGPGGQAPKQEADSGVLISAEQALKGPVPLRRTRRLGAAGTVVILGAVAVGWWLLSSRAPEVPTVPMKITPFTTDGGQKWMPRLSPDGERVAYGWAGPADDNWDIHVKALGVGAEPFRLTEHPAQDSHPVWSTDGRQIAFVRSSEEGAALYTVPSSGGQERKLIDVAGAVSVLGYFVPSLSWSPDGEWMALGEKSPEDAPARIVKLSLDTLEKQPLTAPPESHVGDLYPELSPDGSQLAFVRASGKSDFRNLELWVQPVDGGEARQLTFGGHHELDGLAWTPDGESILFTVRPSEIVRVNLAGGEPEPVVGVGRNAGHASIQGTRMVYEQRTSLAGNIWRVPGRRASGSRREPEAVVASSQDEDFPSYSPDGRSIAFISSRGGRGHSIWVCDSDGTHQVQMTDFKDAGPPHWSPDGRRLVFDSPEEGDYNLYVIDVEGGIPRRLTPEASNEGVGKWSRDGRWIYFRSDRSGRWEIWRMPSEGGDAVQVTRGGGFYAQESSDRRHLYYVTSLVSGLWTIPVEGGEEPRVVLERVYWSAWAPSPSGLYYMTRREVTPDRKYVYTIWFLDRESGRVTELSVKKGSIWRVWLAVSPDEEWVIYSEGPLLTSELMLVENFR